MKNFGKKKMDIFLNLAQNNDCEYMLEAPHQGSNEYPTIYILEQSIPLRTSVLLQVNLIIQTDMLSLGSMETDRVISEPCYNEVIYNRHIAK